MHLETAEVLSPADIDEHGDLYSAFPDGLPAGVDRSNGRDLGKPGSEETPPGGVISQRKTIVLFTTAVPLVGADTASRSTSDRRDSSQIRSLTSSRPTGNGQH